MKHMRSQKGMTAIGWLFLLVILGFFAIIGIKLVPIYIAGFNMYSSLESIKHNSSLKTQPMLEVRKKVMASLDINYASDVKSDDVTINKSGKGLEVSVAYEVYRPIIGNLGLLVTFEKSVIVE